MKQPVAALKQPADFMFSVLFLFDWFLLFSRSVRSELEACFLSFFAGPIGAYRSVEADLKSAPEVIRRGFWKVVACTEIAVCCEVLCVETLTSSYYLLCECVYLHVWFECSCFLFEFLLWFVCVACFGGANVCVKLLFRLPSLIFLNLFFVL